MSPGGNDVDRYLWRVFCAVRAVRSGKTSQRWAYRKHPTRGKRKRYQAGKAQAIVAFPIEKVLPAIYDYANYAKFLPNFQTSKVLSKRGANAIVYLEALVIKRTYKVWVQESFRELPAQGRPESSKEKCSMEISSGWMPVGS